MKVTTVLRNIPHLFDQSLIFDIYIIYEIEIKSQVIFEFAETLIDTTRLEAIGLGEVIFLPSSFTFNVIRCDSIIQIF